MGIIQELLLEGVIVLWHDYRAGHCLDLSPNNNDGTPSANILFEGFDLRFPVATEEVTVADSAELQLTAGSIIAIGRFRRQIAAGGGLVAKRVGAASNYYLYMTTTSMGMYDGTVARTLAMDISGARMLGATFTDGGTPIGYMDGLSRGNLSGAIDVIVNNNPIEIGNYANGGQIQSPLSSVMIINRILTAAEMAQLYAELANLTWPTGFRSFAKRTQAVERADSKLLSGWDLRPIGGVVPDEITTRDLVTINRMMSKPGILGEGMTGPVEGYLATANQVYANADFSTNGMSLETWVRLHDIVGVGRYIMTVNGRSSLYRNTSTLLGSVYDSAPGHQTASSAAAALRANHLIHVVLTTEANGAVRLYLDGTLQPTVDTMLNYNIDVARASALGAFHDGTLGVAADFYKPRIYNYELSQAEVSAKYLEGAKAIQFKTDWAYQVSPAAEGGVIHGTIGTRSSPFRAGDAVGRWLIETDEVDGRLCKVLTCSTAGLIYLPGSLLFDATPTERSFGTFGLWAYKADASVMDMNLISNLNTGITTGYGLQWAANESVAVVEYGVGDVVAGGTASHSVWHRFRLTRASNGDFVAYIDDVTFGNGNDLTTTTSEYMLFDMDVGDKLALGSINGDECLFKMLGVVAP